MKQDGKIFTFSTDATYTLMNNLEFDVDDFGEWIKPSEDPNFTGNFYWQGHTITVTQSDESITIYSN